MTYLIRPIRADETGAVARLHRQAFAPAQVARTIHGGHGVERYLASLISYPGMRDEHVLLGAWEGDALVGYMHARAIAGAEHLNNIAVAPVAKSRGVGRHLWRQFTEVARARGHTRLSLHVEAENTAVLAWYARHGLQVVEETRRYEKALEPGTSSMGDVGVELRGWEGAEAWQLAYGFSQFELQYGDRTWNIGRLGEEFFRITEPVPQAVERALAALDPARRLLLLTSATTEVGDDFEEAGRTLRMEGAVARTGASTD